MRRAVVLRLVLPAFLALTVGPSDAAIVAVLTATVGPGATITLKKGTVKVTTLKPGAYTIKVNDMATSHNFHLTGPGVNKSTTVAFKGMATWTVTLKIGTYIYVCDPHKSFMKGSFTVKN